MLKGIKIEGWMKVLTQSENVKSIRQLSKKIDMTNYHVYLIIKHLKQKGWIEVNKKRLKTNLKLTKKGEKIKHHLLPIIEEIKK